MSTVSKVVDLSKGDVLNDATAPPADSLREAISADLRKRGYEAHTDDIVITHGGDDVEPRPAQAVANTPADWLRKRSLPGRCSGDPDGYGAGQCDHCSVARRAFCQGGRSRGLNQVLEY